MSNLSSHQPSKFEGKNPDEQGFAITTTNAGFGDDMQGADHQPLDFLTAAMPPEVWTLFGELATVDRLLEDPALMAPFLNTRPRFGTAPGV